MMKNFYQYPDDVLTTTCSLTFNFCITPVMSLLLILQMGWPKALTVPLIAT